MFFLYTPFFALSMFLSMTDHAAEKERITLALKTTFSVLLISLILLFFGNQIFKVFGITVDAFRIGAGSLLFLSAVSLIQGKKTNTIDPHDDFTVVPLAIPTIVGPATIGTIMVMGSEFGSLDEKITGSFAVAAAAISVGIILIVSSYIERAIKKRGIIIISKLTGLILAALAAQMIFTGIKSFLF
ncbi:MAG: MarC family protein [Spirochaetales bacterium]|nr:MarC family protein [Spirochaetales bacterium]